MILHRPIKIKATVAQFRKLMRHQANCCLWIESMNIQHPALFMEMRLGKTLTTIRMCRDIWRIKGPILIVAPVTVLEAWEIDLTEEYEEFIVLHGKSLKQRKNMVDISFAQNRRIWCLINYDSVRATPGIETRPWSVVALDESTAIKSPTSKISRICCEGFRKVPHRMILSGLPSPEGEIDLYQQFKFLHGSFMGCDNFYKYRARYFYASDIFGGWALLPSAKRNIKAEVHRLAFVMNRKDAGLPGVKLRTIHAVDMLPNQRADYKQVATEFATWLDRGEEEVLAETEHVIVQHTWLARIAGGCDAEGNYLWDPKAKELLRILQEPLKDQPVVVWFRFNAELLAVCEMLNANGLEARPLVGSMARSERVATLEWFRTSKNPKRILLCQIKLAKYGVNASSADAAIYYSMVHAGEDIGQSEDRIYHPMKDCPLLYIYLIARGTLDRDVYRSAVGKVTSAKELMSRINDTIRKEYGKK